MAAGWCTVLLDAAWLPRIRKSGFNPLEVAAREIPKKEFDKLRRWAGRGHWLAVRAHPDIADSDAVPGLDLVFQKPKRRSAKPKAPERSDDPTWFDPVSQFLDLPSGELIVVYERDFFEPDASDEMQVFRVEGIDEQLANPEFENACIYRISCEPGFYSAHAFSRDVDLTTEAEQPELAIYLTPTIKPKSFQMADAVLPLHPADQDLNAMRRKAKGLPLETPPANPRLLANGDYVAQVHSTMGGELMVMPNHFLKKLKLQPGVLVQLEVDNMMTDGVIVVDATPDPTSWELIEKVKRKARNFATLRHLDDRLLIEVIKESRTDPFRLEEGISYTGKLRATKDATGQVQRIATRQDAKGHKHTVPLPRKPGKPGPAIEELAGWIEQTSTWTQCCLFEVDGTTRIGAVYASPPVTGTNIHGESYSMSPEIVASVAIVDQGVPTNETTCNFRGWPDGIARAFQWVAKQAAGGLLWTNRYEINPDFWSKKRTFKKKDAEQIAIAAWKEIFGLD
jgi:antitoxin component of MazEF toxin-antitoxin module